ncbi:hypothetical protein TAMA11512_04840 [Selenomonas sp. TAMA-11512]|uniref:hypothetical protein n=1 Tax=Selenomonas sp. TAMA-11512 TaxID=3095337 RepID=UPI00309164D6|nr:hypothetical protein TAMA11512_04840 [Selenomonas sp. TAMA-11512]
MPSTTKSSAKAPAKKPAAKKAPAKKPAAAKSSLAFIFFNCDNEKSQTSMNIFYNREIFRDTKVGRNALWKKVSGQIEEDHVKASAEDLAAAKAAILEGNPVDAGQYLQFASIAEVTCY